jgi:hypothetical protein
MLGGLVEANLESRPERRADFERLRAKVGFELRDAGESATLDFQGGRLLVWNGLQPGRRLTVRTDSETVLQLSGLAIGPFGMPAWLDAGGRAVLMKLLSGRLKIDGMVTSLGTLNRVARLFSVR